MSNNKEFQMSRKRKTGDSGSNPSNGSHSSKKMASRPLPVECSTEKQIDVPNEQHSRSDLSKKVDFSFQTKDRGLLENPSAIQSEKEKKEVASSSSHIMQFSLSSDLSRREDKEPEVVVPKRILTCGTGRKLLILDLNGLLADIIRCQNSFRGEKRIWGTSVFRRPFCKEFLKFCFKKFDIGVWSSRNKYIVEDAVDYIIGDDKHKLLFCWDQSKCTITGFNTIENAHKPVILKELKKLWDKEDPSLPWEKGMYSPSNTLLVDDSPYKALCNPPHTAIFPYSYRVRDRKDNSLGPKGDLRLYLEGLAMADDVQLYVRDHAFGQRAVTPSHPSWEFYLKIINNVENSSAST